MDGLCFKTGVPVFSSTVPVSGSQNSPGSMQICPVGRGGGLQANANGISVENPIPQSSVSLSSSRYFFTYPLRSLWPSRKSQEDALHKEDDEGPVLELATDGEIYPNMGLSLEEVQESDEQEGQEIAIGSSNEQEENEPVESSDQIPSQPNGYFNKRGNWVLKILHIRSLWKSQRESAQVSGSDECEKQESGNEDLNSKTHCSCSEEGSEGCSVDEEPSCSSDGEIPIADVQHDRDSFSRLLRRVSLIEAKVYGQMSYLGNLAYTITQIKSGHLLKYQGLRFVTSSLEKKAQAATTGKEQAAAEVIEREKLHKHDGESHRKKGISPSTAYQIAAAAASYLHSQTRSILPFKSARASVSGEDTELSIKSPSTGDSSEDRKHVETGLNLSISSSAANPTGAKISSSEVASFVATTNSVTAVVAAKEEMRQAVAEDLNSARSSPCEWFICDDELTRTRFFVIQGSESLASWQANLLFEPIQFEGLDVLVHRGIYEAAKGIYEQMLPEVHAHLKSHGDSATFRFTGHSLGGSLSLLVNLMLLIRGEVPKSSLLPIVTFGSPCIMCGGDHLLRKLGLPRSHVQAITMHRDIVPRAFSCNYPDHVAELLKAVNSNFRKHPCLKNQKLLYAPMGELLILQPEESVSPHHPLLPLGSGLFLLSYPGTFGSNTGEMLSQLRAAQIVFFNSPHPLEILSDPAAYGSDGAIRRDHDVNSYVRCVRAVIRQELKLVRKANREHRRRYIWWPLVAPQGPAMDIVAGYRPETSIVVGQEQQRRHSFSSVVQSGKESLRRFSRLVASQHVHLLVMFLFPARLLILEAFTVIRYW